MTKIHLLFMAAQFAGKKVSELSSHNQTEFWRLKLAGYLVEHWGIIYETTV